MGSVIYADCFILVLYNPCEMAIYCTKLSEVHNPAVVSHHKLDPVTPFGVRNECFDF